MEIYIPRLGTMSATQQSLKYLLNEINVHTWQETIPQMNMLSFFFVTKSNLTKNRWAVNATYSHLTRKSKEPSISSLISSLHDV
jgi:hypothetical protein